LLYAVTSVPAHERSGPIFDALGAFMTDQRPAAVPVDQLALMVRPTGTALDQKIAALAAVSTQNAPLLSAFGWDGYATHAAEEAYVEANVRARDPSTPARNPRHGETWPRSAARSLAHDQSSCTRGGVVVRDGRDRPQTRGRPISRRGDPAPWANADRALRPTIRNLPSEVLLEPGEDPVRLPSAVNLDSVESVSTAILVERLGRLGGQRRKASRRQRNSR
jgi:hypothetical protein